MPIQVHDTQPLTARLAAAGRQVEEQRTVTAGGMLIPEAGKERPMCGEVVRVGPGKPDSEDKMPVAPGDKVIYFKYAGDVIPTAAKGRYIVVHARDILCKNAA